MDNKSLNQDQVDYHSGSSGFSLNGLVNIPFLQVSLSAELSKVGIIIFFSFLGQWKMDLPSTVSPTGFFDTSTSTFCSQRI